jgi:hypothetical protein
MERRGARHFRREQLGPPHDLERSILSP